MNHEYPPPPNQSGIQGIQSGEINWPRIPSAATAVANQSGIQSGEINWDAAARDSSAQDAYEKGILLPEDL